MSNLPRQIIGSFEDIGKSIGGEVVKLPGDIAGKALESLGTVKSGQKSAPNVQMIGQHDATPKSKDGWDKIDENNDQKIKKAVARAALEALVMRQKPKKKSVWETLQEEAQHKKELEATELNKAAKLSLPQAQAKRPRGDLYGIKAKKASAEMSRNVRQD
jgi:iron uptake system EfeUOB component EfeO/EfeM